MSVEHLAVVLHHSQARGTAKIVMLGIANHAGDEGSFPKIATLARYANVHPRKITEALRRLEALGELVVYEQQGRGPKGLETNLYELTVTCPPWCDRTPNHRDVRLIDVRLPGM